jgi:uncharacterized protein YbjT (DUF2867 family)
MNNTRILIAGATGQQGGTVVDALVGSGHTIFGLTRNPDSEKSQALAARGVTVVKGNLQDGIGLTEALEQVDSFFFMTTPFEAGIEAETEQGINAVDAAKEAGIRHVVFSSVADADKETGVPHFDSKYRVEQHLRASGVPFTILAPAFFYDNMMAPFVLPGLQDGTLAQALPAEVKLQSVSARNIGEFAALALLNPDRFVGRRIDFAGDELTGPEYAQVIGRVGGKDIGYYEVPLEQIRSASEDMALMYDWFSRVGYSADIPSLKNEYPEVKWERFSQWADRQDWGVLST